MARNPTLSPGTGRHPPMQSFGLQPGHVHARSVAHAPARTAAEGVAALPSGMRARAGARRSAR